ncbi:MAG: 3'-5' exonuclease [Verrucomicrobiota bacterium]
MDESQIHVIDFEGSRQSGILEFGLVTLRGPLITGVQTRLCAPEGTIADHERAQHGISEAVLEGELPFRNEWLRFAHLRETGVLCAHNASVEDGLLRSVWATPRVSPDFTGEGRPSATWGPWLDTLYLYRSIYPGLESYNLSALVEVFGLVEALDMQAAVYCPPNRNRYHCALYDTLASALLLRRLYEEPQLAGLSLPWLLQHSAASSADRDALGQQELF